MKYTVRGSGTFPIDMLRVDKAYPCTQADSMKIVYLTRRPHEAQVQNIELYSEIEPDRCRWASYGFIVLTDDDATVYPQAAE